MEYFIKEIFEGKDSGHRYFVKFSKGEFNRKFLISFVKGKQIKIYGSYELSNSFVEFVKENFDVGFSGKILMTEKVGGLNGRKKAGSYVYDVNESKLDEFEDIYYSLVDANNDEVVLKIKKSLPKLGQNAEKIDNKFCMLQLDLKYLEKVKEKFFWDVPAGAKKVIIEHKVNVNDIVLPTGIKDPIEVRKLAKRKGKIVRKLNVDGSESEKSIDFEV